MTRVLNLAHLDATAGPYGRYRCEVDAHVLDDLGQLSQGTTSRRLAWRRARAFFARRGGVRGLAIALFVCGDSPRQQRLTQANAAAFTRKEN
jgi:hypothetical protein